ncbi:MAG: hypothetical protein RLZZ458_2512 [Planctomycetota bacterium]
MSTSSGRVFWRCMAGSAVGLMAILAFRHELGLSLAMANMQEGTERPSGGVQEGGKPERQDEPKKGLSKFMRQKLDASSKVLEGLCTEDLEMVAEGSRVLLKMSHEERWRVSTDMMYRRYSNEFSVSVEELLKESEDQDMDGTSMAWVNVTMKCLKCHEWVRNTIIAGQGD